MFSLKPSSNLESKDFFYLIQVTEFKELERGSNPESPIEGLN